MKSLIACRFPPALFCVALVFLAMCAHTPLPLPLNTGRFITPATQSSWDVGNMPMNLMLTPDRRFAIVSDMGYREALWSVRVSDGVGVSHLDFNFKKKSKHKGAVKPAGEDSEKPTVPGSPESIGLYYGLAISPTGTIYASQGAHDSIAILHLSPAGALIYGGSIKTRRADFPAGLAMDNRGLLYVANNASGTEDPVTMSGSVAIYNPATKRELGRCTFSSDYLGTSNFPFGIAVLPSGDAAYVASERDDCVYGLDTHDPAHPQVIARISTGAHPSAVLLSRDSAVLYVANSLSDTVSVIDTVANRVLDTILLRPDMARDLPGTSPTAMALSDDGDTLYVALGDMNAVAVIDTTDMQVLGYVPVGWYPSSLAVIGKNRLLVANAKGTTVHNPNNYPDPYDKKRKNMYILNVLHGNVCSVRVPQGDDLAKATQQVLTDSRLTTLSQPQPNPLAGIGLSSGKITHIFYIIKENRTYDQILGDLPQGTGDKSLVLFGRNITPNQHALAERFTLLDNLYACGEVSGDGWTWSTQGMADAYVERNIPYHYSNRGRAFDFEGENNNYITGGFPAKDTEGKPLSTQPSGANGEPPIPNVASTGVHLWDIAEQAGISLRNYGFFLSTYEHPTTQPDNYPTVAGLQPPGHDLRGVTDADYRRFNLDYADSDAPENFARQTHRDISLFKERVYGKYDAPCRFVEWNREFQMMLAEAPDGSTVPELTLLRLPNDHTMGAKEGKHIPEAYVADNDYALGEIVQAISHSPIWKSSAIFVIEDDAQSGADHVDAHRTTGYIISPWIRPHSVDHRFCNTDSMLKTIELLLGLGPMSQYDAVADPILDWRTGLTESGSEPYEAIEPSRKLFEQLNPKEEELSAGDPRREMARESAAMDFVHADAAPALLLDEIVWKTVKGPQSSMPIMHQTLPMGVHAPADTDDDGDDN